ncbi:MAG: hypothetical protein ACRD2C_20125 [Acidimicrobiales bacterium]
MTDEADARALVQAFLSSDDFELEEIPQGWRVVRPIPRDLTGAATLAVERATGALWEFASSVPPHRLGERFEQFKASGRRIDQPPR